MSAAPQRRTWAGRDALIMVHGIGNPVPGDYDDLEASVRTLLGARADEFAVYTLYYDELHDWVQAKTQLNQAIRAFNSVLRRELFSDSAATALADAIGDVLWPVLHAASRLAIREALLAQFKQTVRDGLRAGIGVWDQRISIMAHSLGCLHVYEALHAAASDPVHALRPLSNGVTFRNVIFIASPVQIIRSTLLGVRQLFPYRPQFAALGGEGLSIPGQLSVTGYREPSVKRWLSITGVYDPLGGYLMRRRITGAWMDVAGQESVIDEQTDLMIHTMGELLSFVREIAVRGYTARLSAMNPHSWRGYVDRNSERIGQCLLSA